MNVIFKHQEGSSKKKGDLRVNSSNNSVKLGVNESTTIEVEEGERLDLVYGPYKEAIYLKGVKEGDIIDLGIDKVDLKFNRSVIALLFGMGVTLKARIGDRVLNDEIYIHGRRDVIIAAIIAFIGCLSSLVYAIAEYIINPAAPVQGLIIVVVFSLSVLYSVAKLLFKKNEDHMAYSAVFFAFILCLVAEMIIGNPNPLSVPALVLAGVFSIGSIFLSSWAVK